MHTLTHCPHCHEPRAGAFVCEHCGRSTLDLERNTEKETRSPETPAGANPDQDQQGIHVRASMTLEETYKVLRTKLGDLVDEYFSAMYQYDETMAATLRGKADIKARGFGALTGRTKLEDLRYRWIAVYPVTGGSEGHYIHVDLLWEREYQQGRVPLFLGKTFGGMEQAIQIAGILAAELEQAGLV